MPQESVSEAPKRWYNFHFSGKVIMCSVLFGLGLVLVGGLIMAIGMDQKSDSMHENLDEIQYKAPMVIVGPVLMGIGAFTVITGIIMCLFEMNICRKKEFDSKPLVEEKVSDAAGSTSLPSQKREKHRKYKKASSRKHKKVLKNSPDKTLFESSSSCSPSSKPIDVQNSQDFSNSDNFLTPSSSFVPVSDKASKFLESSDKSWNTSAEFQTPSSSLQNSEFSEHVIVEKNSEKLDNNKFEVLQNVFLTPKNSSRNTEENVKESQKRQNNEEEKESINNLKHDSTENLYTDNSKCIPQKNNTESYSQQNSIKKTNDF